MADQTQVEARAAEIRRLLEEIAFLSKSDLPTQEYFRRFLELSCRALDAPGGVIWLKGGQGYQRLCALKFPDSEFETNEAQRQSILKALADVTENRRPVVVGALDPSAAVDENVTVVNRTRFPFFFTPIQLNNQVVVILHVWLPPETDPKLYRDFVTFLQTVSGQAEIYLRARRLESLTAESQKLSQLVTLLGEMQGLLDSDKLSLIAANYGRDVIGADRVCVAIRRREKTKVLAVSGVETVDKKSALVKTIGTLAQRALTAEEPQTFLKGGEQTADEEISQYFSGGNMRAAYVVPFKNRDEKTIGALVVETTRPDGIGEATRKLAQAVARHTGAAIGAAEEETSVPFLPTLRKLKRGKEWAMGSKRRRIQLAIGVPVAALTLIGLIPSPFRIAGDCQLLPLHHATAVAEVQGRIASVAVHEGQPVEKGELLAQLDDSELQTRWRVAKGDYDKAAADADFYFNSPKPDARGAWHMAESSKQKAAAEMEMLRQQIEQTKIRSPLRGAVLSRDLESRVGQTIDRGSEFAQVGEPTHWQAILQTKESDVAPLENRLRLGQWLDVTVLTRGRTAAKLHGYVRNPQNISQLSYPPPDGSGANVFFTTVDLDLSAAEAALLRPGFSGRGKVDVGWRPLAYIVGRKFVDYLRVNWLL